MALDSKTREVARYVVKLALYSAVHEDREDYTQGPQRWDGIDNSRDYPEQPHHADCSAHTGTWLTWAARRHVRGSAGVDVINGQSWKRGYTGTMIEHGARHRSTTSTTKWHPGRTHVFYADHGSTPTHTAVFVGDVWLEAGTRYNGKILTKRKYARKVVISHGRTAGPEAWTFNYRRIVQARAYPV